MVSFALHVAEKVIYKEPKTYREAVSCSEKKDWIRAMNEEIESLLKNKT